jgi:hypothetical protein
MTSGNEDPPKPRLMMVYPGKYWSTSVQNRKEELPTNKMAPFGGKLTLSCCLKAFISPAKACASVLIWKADKPKDKTSVFHKNVFINSLFF